MIDREDARLMATLAATDSELNHYTAEQRNLGRSYLELESALRRVLPWLGKLIADKGHLASVLPQ